MIKAIIFDFDGVIHNSFDFHWKKVNEFSRAYLTEDEFRDVHNGNFFKNENNKLKDVNWVNYRSFIYEDMIQLKIEDSIKKTLFTLSKTHDLFIISSGGKKNISDYLENNDIEKIFKEVLGGELSRHKVDKFNFLFQKYSLNPDDCIFITDTLGDILEANKSNVKTIAVDFGYHSRKTLEKGNPFKIISSFDEIVDIV